MILIDGKKIAAELREELKQEVSELKSKYNKVPGLTVILIGDLAPSQIYVRNKEKSANEVGLKSEVIDNLDKPGGQCAELYPEKPIFDIPSQTSITGKELTDDLMIQAKPFHPVFHLNQQVEKVEKLNNSEWVISTNQGKVIQAKCIVIAAGAGSFVPRKVSLEGIEHFEGKNVFYSVRDKNYKY